MFLYQSKNVVMFVTLTFIGIKACSVPHISEHCPKYSPNLFTYSPVWLRWPGTASTFTPKEGMVQLWITSAPVTLNLMFVSAGNTNFSSTSSNLSCPSFKSSFWTIYESNDIISLSFFNVTNFIMSISLMTLYLVCQ